MPSPEKTARNRQIVQRWLKGETCRAIGRRYAITHVRVLQILAREASRHEWQEDPNDPLD